MAVLQKKVSILETRLKEATFSVTFLKACEKHAKVFTGLPSWKVFSHIYEFVSPHASPSASIGLEDELLLTLCRLWLGLRLEDLAVKFAISSPTASKIFDKWIRLLYVRLRFLIAWPSREVCSQNMPSVFKELYPACRCIIDCSEIFIEMPIN